MAASHALLLFCNLAFFVFLASTIAQFPVVTATSVDDICRQTSNYQFCKDALYSDPRTPDGDGITLAYVAFGLAYRKSVSIQNQLLSLLSNSTGPVHQKLEHCQGDYVKAMAIIRSGLTNLDNKSYFGLARLGTKAGNQALDCESVFKGTASPLADANKEFKWLSEICYGVGALFWL